MALTEDVEALTKAFSGYGVDEKSVISILGKWGGNERESFRKLESPKLFQEDDERQFQKWNDQCVRHLKHEFMRFKNAIVLRAMHQWERDARLVKEALKKGPQAYGTVIEIACTRSSQDLLGARKAYHSLFDHSIEEDVAFHVQTIQRKMLVALVSAYRYEGTTKVKDEIAEKEAQALSNAIKNSQNKPIIEDDEVIRILATRSKPHIQAIYNHYNHISGKNLDEDLEDSRLKETVQCLCVPHTYFSQVLDAALKAEDKNVKKALTRVIVSRADTDIKEIQNEYQNLFGVSLSQKIEEVAKGNYKDFLLALIARGD